MKIEITWKNIYVDNKSQNSNANFKRCQIFGCTEKSNKCKNTIKTVVLVEYCAWRRPSVLYAYTFVYDYCYYISISFDAKK